MAGTPDISLAQHIATEIGSLTYGTNVFASAELPMESGIIPLNAVFVHLYGGQNPRGFIGGSTDRYYEHRLVVTVRGSASAYRSSLELAQSVREACHYASITGYFDVLVSESSPLYLGHNDRDAHRWTVNVRMIERSS